MNAREYSNNTEILARQHKSARIERRKFAWENQIIYEPIEQTDGRVKSTVSYSPG